MLSAARHGAHPQVGGEANPPDPPYLYHLTRPSSSPLHPVAMNDLPKFPFRVYDSVNQYKTLAIDRSTTVAQICAVACTLPPLLL